MSNKIIFSNLGLSPFGTYETIFRTKLNGYNPSERTYTDREMGYVSLDKLLYNLRIDNQYGISVEDILRGNDKKYTCRIYYIPTQHVYFFSTESDVRDYNCDTILYSINTGDIAGIGRQSYTAVARVYAVMHYSMDGQEIWYYDNYGRKSRTPYYFSSSKQTEQLLQYKVRDCCAKSLRLYVDPRTLPC